MKKNGLRPQFVQVLNFRKSKKWAPSPKFLLGGNGLVEDIWLHYANESIHYLVPLVSSEKSPELLGRQTGKYSNTQVSCRFY